MLQSTRNNTLFEQIIREEYNKVKQQRLIDSVNEQKTKPSSSGKPTANKKISGVRYDLAANVFGVSPSGVMPASLAADPLDALRTSLAYAPKTPSSCNPNYHGNSSKEKAWPDKAAYNLLFKTFKACPIESGMKSDRFELDIYFQPESGKKYLTDRMRFSSDGKVYSHRYQTEYNWKRSGSAISISSTKGERQGDIVIFNNIVTYNIDPKILQKYKEASAAQKDNHTNVIDVIQTVLDWTGMIEVYGIGVASDAINLILYSARGMWIDALLSAIGIIPFMSAGVTAARPIVKKLRGVFSKTVKIDPKVLERFHDVDLSSPAGADACRELFEELYKHKVLGKEELKAINSMFENLDQYMQSKLVNNIDDIPLLSQEAKRGMRQAIGEFQLMLRNAAGGAANQLADAFTKNYQTILDKVAETNSFVLRSAGTKADDVIDGLKAADEKIAALARKGGWFGKGAGLALRIPATIVPKLVARGFKLSKTMFDKITHMITIGFKTQLLKNPQMISYAVRMLPNPVAILRAFEAFLRSNFPTSYAKLLAEHAADIHSQSIFFNSVANTTKAGKTTFRTGDEIVSQIQLETLFARYIPSVLGNAAKAMEQFIDLIGNELIKSNSPIWSLYKNNFSRQMQAVFKAGPKTFGDFIHNTKINYKIVDFGNIAKYYDILYSEIKDAFDSFDSSDDADKHADGFIWQYLLVPGFNKALDSMQVDWKWVKSAYNNLYAPQVNALLNYYGPDSVKTQPTYNPNDKLVKDKKAGKLKR